MTILVAAALDEDPGGAIFLKSILADGRKHPPAEPDRMAFVPKVASGEAPVVISDEGGEARAQEPAFG